MLRRHVLLQLREGTFAAWANTLADAMAQVLQLILSGNLLIPFELFSTYGSTELSLELFDFWFTETLTMPVWAEK